MLSREQREMDQRRGPLLKLNKLKDENQKMRKKWLNAFINEFIQMKVKAAEIVQQVKQKNEEMKMRKSNRKDFINENPQIEEGENAGYPRLTRRHSVHERRPDNESCEKFRKPPTSDIIVGGETEEVFHSAGQEG